MRVINGYNAETRERVLSLHNVDETNPAFWQEFRDTNVWKRFVEMYVATPANFERIIDILTRLYPNQDYFSVDQVEHAFKTGLNSGGTVNDPLDRAPVEETVSEPEPVQVDRNGRPLSASQIAFGEMSRFSETATSAQIKERKRVDPAYLRFVQHSLREQMNQPVDGDVTPFNPHL